MWQANFSSEYFQVVLPDSCVWIVSAGEDEGGAVGGRGQGEDGVPLDPAAHGARRGTGRHGRGRCVRMLQ